MIGFDATAHQIQLEETPSLAGIPQWFLDGEPVALLREEADICTLAPWPGTLKMHVEHLNKS